MTKKEREKILTAICKRIAKSDYGLLKENFEKEYNSRIDSDNRHSGDFTIEGRLMKRKIPKDYDEQKDWMKCVIKKLQDSSYVFDESDIENLNSFTSGINYLLKRTAASEAGMYDRVNLIKHGIACNDHLLDIAKLFNEIKTNTTWDSFKNMENGCYNFFF